MFYIIKTDEGVRMTRQAPSPLEAVTFLAQVVGTKLRWVMYDGELVGNDFITPKRIAPMRKTR